MSHKADADLVRAVRERRLAAGTPQRVVAARVGVTQPHFSKVERGLVPLSARMRARMRDELSEGAGAAPPEADIEAAALAAIRSSGPFRALVASALKLHKSA